MVSSSPFQDERQQQAPAAEAAMNVDEGTGVNGREGLAGRGAEKPKVWRAVLDVNDA